MGVTKKIGAATNSRKNYKKNYKKKPGGELICKNFGVPKEPRERDGIATKLLRCGVASTCH